MSKKNKKEANQFFRAQTDRREDDPYYNLAKSKDNWRLAFFICATSLLLVTGAFIVRSFQTGFVPYLVSVDDFSQVTVLGSAEELNANHDRLIRAELYKWLRGIRSVHGDPDMMQEQLENAFSMISRDVAGRLNEDYSNPDRDPLLLARNYRRSIEVNQILQTDNEGNWRLQWVEITTNRSGGQSEAEQWEAFIHVENFPPRTSENILENPLGIVITELNWGSISPSTQIEE